MIPPALAERIARCTVVSFDVFDTALLRAVAAPVDVFALVAAHYAVERQVADFGFAAAREQAERSARALTHAADVTLAEIYGCLTLPPGWERERLLALEQEVELHLSAPNAFIHAVYRHARAAGKRVVFASDMYLPHATVAALLERGGYRDYHRLYVSSAAGATKWGGALFRHMLDDLAVAPEQVLHIGDNPQSDVAMARRAGIDAWHYPACATRAPAAPVHPSLAGRVHRGLVNHRLHAQLRPARDEFWFRVGYEVAGVLYLGFADWLLAEATRAGVERLYFLARDGHVMRRVYDLVAAERPGAPPSTYLAASRRALNLPALERIDERALDFLAGGSTLMSVAQYCERAGLDAAAHGPALHAAGFATPTELVTPQRRDALRRLFRRLAPELLALAARERPLALRYFAAEGLFAPGRAAVVDIGWHGTLQRSLAALARLAGSPVELRGFYLATFSAAAKAPAGQLMTGYLCTNGAPAALERLVHLSVEIFEFLHLAPHGGVIGFVERAGRVVPVESENDAGDAKRAAAAALQSGALAFVADFLALRRGAPWLTIPRELAVAPLARLLSAPSYEEATRFGDLEHVEGFGAPLNPRWIAKPPPLRTLLSRPVRLFDAYRGSFWKRGFRARVLGSVPLVPWAAAQQRRLAALRPRWRAATRGGAYVYFKDRVYNFAQRLRSW